jgi:O-antigen ligase
MSGASRSFDIAPAVTLAAFMAAALALGGSSRGPFIVHGALEIGAAVLLLVGLWVWSADNPVWREGRLLLVAAGGVLFVGLLQLVPLPASVWPSLPGRAEIAAGFPAIGAALPALGLSLDPAATRDALLGLMPPLAAFVLAARLNLRKQGLLIAWALGGFAVISVVLGIVQMQGGLNSPLYVYQFQNRGYPTGFFANVNHQATLLLMTVPFLLAAAGNLRFRGSGLQPAVGKLGIIGSMLLIVVIGIVLCGSFAGYAMLGPVLALGIVLALGRWLTGGRIALFWAGVLLLAAAGATLAASPILKEFGLAAPEAEGAMGRPNLFARTIEGGLTYFPFGAGLGAFPAAFPRFENPETVSNVFANHAHSDYLELFFELGVFGILIVALALFWFVRTTIQIWRTDPSTTSRLRRAASIALGVAVVHSLVDYPLRTIAIATLAGLCAGLMIAPQEVKTQRSKPDANQPQRSVEL